MPQTGKVIPIREETSFAAQQEEIVNLAFEYWLDRFGLREGDPREDLLNAAQDVSQGHRRNTRGRLFLACKQSS